MEEKKNLLTYAGLKALEDELHDLKVNRRKEVAGKIKEAREQGDLSENAEYDAAKDEQRDIEARIEEIEKILKNAEVVVEDEVDLDKISVGCSVKIYDEEYEEEISTREVKIGENEPTIVEILAKALNGDIATYTLEIYKENSNNNIKEITVDGNSVTKSKTDEDTYEYTLDKVTSKVTIGAIAEAESSMVGINTFEKEQEATYQDIKMEGRSIVVNIYVTAEDGTTKTYKLIVYALPDNVNLLHVKVNGKDATAVPVNKYQTKVNKNDTSFELYVIPEDEKAKVQINTNKEVTGTANATIAKEKEEVEVNIKVTAQDGTTQNYTLIVSNQSDDSKLAILKVDGQIIEQNEDGKYYVEKKFIT